MQMLDGLLSPGHRRFRLIDLFSGAGGLTVGFTEYLGPRFHPAEHTPYTQEGCRTPYRFQPVWANDFDPDAVATYNLNFGAHCHQGPIEEALADPGVPIPQADVVIGGPPCQGFSLLNKNRAGDERRVLWRPFMDVVIRSGADIFVMENVQQLLTSDECAEISELARSLGFKVVSAKLLAADYGVPQLRWRAFIIGSRYGTPDQMFPPRKTHSSRDAVRQVNGNGAVHELPRWRSVHDWIGDLPAKPVGREIRPEVGPPLDLHFGRNPTDMSLRRYHAVPDEGMNRFDLQQRAPELTPACWVRKKTGGTDLFGRLWWDKPAFTIRTEFYKPEKGRYLHPAEHRPITHREAARLQAFPDWFRFTGSKTEVAKQIGNAVPPLLAARVADVVYELLLAREPEVRREHDRTPALAGV